MPEQQAVRLVHDAKLSDATGALRAYNTEGVRLALLETRQVHAELAPLAEAARAAQAAGEGPNAALAARLVTQHLQAYRNKRCILVYHRQRLDWLRARVWEKAGAVSLVLQEDERHGASLRALLDPAELEWVRAYAGLVALYKDAYLDVLDVSWPVAHARARARALPPGMARQALSGADAVYAPHTPAGDVRPPDDVMLSVLVVRSASVETERGTMHLRAGERLYVRRDEVEPLLLRGWLRALDA